MPSIFALTWAAGDWRRRSMWCPIKLLRRIEAGFEPLATILDDGWAQLVRDRLRGNLALLRQP